MLATVSRKATVSTSGGSFSSGGASGGGGGGMDGGGTSDADWISCWNAATNSRGNRAALGASTSAVLCCFAIHDGQRRLLGVTSAKRATGVLSDDTALVPFQRDHALRLQPERHLDNLHLGGFDIG